MSGKRRAAPAVAVVVFFAMMLLAAHASPAHSHANADLRLAADSAEQLPAAAAAAATATRAKTMRTMHASAEEGVVRSSNSVRTSPGTRAAGGAGLSVGDASASPSTVVFAHRHGARYPLYSMCDPVTECGQLNSVGKDMLRQLGAALRKRYVEDAQTPLFAKDAPYEPTKFVSRSSALDRTIQSSSSMTNGFFPSTPTTTTLPVAKTVASTEDTLIIIDTVPAYFLHNANPSAFAEQQAALLPLVKQLLPWPQLARVARNLSMPDSVCGSEELAAACALAAQDTAKCVLSASQARFDALDPIVAQSLPALDVVMAAWNDLKFGYHPERSEWARTVGSLGQILAQEMLAQLEAFRASNGSLVAKIREYSGHDTTMVPLAETFGLHNETEQDLLPAFGYTMVLEGYLEPAASASASGPELRVRMLTGYPEQTSGSAHAYSFVARQLRCLDAAQRAYRNESCPLADLWRFVNSTAVPGGSCAATKRDLQLSLCDDRGAPPAGADGAVCAAYRRMCPDQACALIAAEQKQPSDARGLMVSPVDLSCVPRGTSLAPPLGPSGDDDTGSDRFSRTQLIEIACGAAAAGVLLGLLLMFAFARHAACCECLHPRDKYAALLDPVNTDRDRPYV